MQRVILKGYIIVPDADLVDVKEELPVHIDSTRNEKGCLVFEVAQDEKVRNMFHVYEEFSNRVAFTAHQDRVRRSKWGLITRNVERFYEVTGLNE